MEPKIKGWTTKVFSWAILFALILVVLFSVNKLLDSDISFTKFNLGNSISPGYYQVVEVFDGDTIAVNMNGVVEKIRLIGVDTPETHDPDEPVQCYGREATAFTQSLLGGQKVRLEPDSLNTNRDRYDRLLRYVYDQQGKMMNAELIKSGYGFAYTYFPLSRTLEFESYESSAKSQGLGLWQACQVSEDDRGIKRTQAVN